MGSSRVAPPSCAGRRGAARGRESGVELEGHPRAAVVEIADVAEQAAPGGHGAIRRGRLRGAEVVVAAAGHRQVAAGGAQAAVTGDLQLSRDADRVAAREGEGIRHQRDQHAAGVDGDHRGGHAGGPNAQRTLAVDDERADVAPAATDVMLQLPWAPTVTGMPLATVPATLKVAAAAPPPTLTAVLLLIEPLPVSVRVPALTVVRPP